MYQVDPPLPVADLASGSYYVTGPPLSQKERLVQELLVNGLQRGENALLISTDRTAEAIHRWFVGRLGTVPETLGIVDCISEQSGGTDERRPEVSYASAPNDLTGIGMYATDHLERFAENEPSQRTRVVLNSVSTLLMYEEFRTVVRFLHVFSNRLELADALGLFVLNPASHESRVVETILELADGVIEVREVGDTVEVRVVSSGSASKWRAF